ncbi:MAG: MBL fold metallo-hydrolase [Alicyclobacillaceae bacterium]|nr:MBL fold metallo-hydrolase [Alicyclobacillaceae bacterium]
MSPSIEVLFQGFPGKTDRGFLGWSSCVLLRNGRLGLFDTAGFPERPELIRRLREKGIAPSDIDFVVLSHYHFDHAVNVSLFPNAAVYLHEREAAHIETCGDTDLAVPREMFWDVKKSGKLRLLSGESGILEETYRWFHTPGHTPGCISLAVETQDGTWVLAGDAIKNLEEAQTGEVWMSLDPAASRKSIAKILEEADWIVPGHDRLLQVVREPNDRLVRPVGTTAGRIRLTLSPERSFLRMRGEGEAAPSRATEVVIEVEGESL